MLSNLSKKKCKKNLTHKKGAGLVEERTSQEPAASQQQNVTKKRDNGINIIVEMTQSKILSTLTVR